MPGLLRAAGPGPALDPARMGGRKRPADGGCDRQPDAAVHARVGRAGRLGGAKRRMGSKVHSAVDTLGHLLALKVTAADQGDRAQVAALAEQV